MLLSNQLAWLVWLNWADLSWFDSFSFFFFVCFNFLNVQKNFCFLFGILKLTTVELALHFCCTTFINVRPAVLLFGFHDRVDSFLLLGCIYSHIASALSRVNLLSRLTVVAPFIESFSQFSLFQNLLAFTNFPYFPPPRFGQKVDAGHQ